VELSIDKLLVCGHEIAALTRGDGVVEGAPARVQYGEWTSQTGH
jgi:hypothetical protein